MKAGELISVIVPVYNVGQYLAQCIESILVQSYPNLEIILVDDGSIDEGATICDAYVVSDKRIKVIHQKNKGLVNARKAGIALATGKYIGYVDGDDWIEPNMYETLLEYMSDEEVDVATVEFILEYSHKKEYSESLFPTGKYDKEHMVQEVYGRMVFDVKNNIHGIMPNVWSKLFKRTLIYNHQMRVDEEISFGEDAACTYPALLDANGLYMTGKHLYHYRQREDSIWNSIQIDCCRQVSILIEYLRGVFSQSKYRKRLFEQLKEYQMSMVPFCLERQFGIKADPFYLFPYKQVTKDSKVVLYGAGMVGQLYQSQIVKTGYCDLVLWVDSNFAAYRSRAYDVSDVKYINSVVYDVIIIAVMKEMISKEIKEMLIQIGVPESKIIWENPVNFNEALFLG